MNKIINIGQNINVAIYTEAMHHMVYDMLRAMPNVILTSDADIGDSVQLRVRDEAPYHPEPTVYKMNWMGLYSLEYGGSENVITINTKDMTPEAACLSIREHMTPRPTARIYDDYIIVENDGSINVGCQNIPFEVIELIYNQARAIIDNDVEADGTEVPNK